TQRTCVLALQLAQEGVCVKTGVDMKGGADLPVDRMLDGHVDQGAAQLDYGVQFFCQTVICVLAYTVYFKVVLRLWTLEQIDAGRCGDVCACGAQQGDIADDDLSADRKAGSDRGSGQRAARLAQQLQNLFAARGSVHNTFTSFSIPYTITEKRPACKAGRQVSRRVNTFIYNVREGEKTGAGFGKMRA